VHFTLYAGFVRRTSPVSRKVDGSAAAFDLEEVFDFMEDGAVVMLIRE
jgi:hypothetical protein